MKSLLDDIQQERNKVIKKLQKYVEKELTVIEFKSAVSVIKKIIELFPKLQEVQPHITKLGFGMGLWYLKGQIVAKYVEEEGLSEEELIDADFYPDYVKDNKGYCVVAPVNEAISEIVSLCDYLVDYQEESDDNLMTSRGLNFSSMIDWIDKDGVTFDREIDPKSPFGHEPLSATEKSPLIKYFKSAKVPYRFVIKK